MHGRWAIHGVYALVGIGAGVGGRRLAESLGRPSISALCRLLVGSRTPFHRPPSRQTFSLVPPSASLPSQVSNCFCFISVGSSCVLRVPRATVRDCFQSWYCSARSRLTCSCRSSTASCSACPDCPLSFSPGRALVLCPSSPLPPGCTQSCQPAH